MKSYLLLLVTLLLALSACTSETATKQLSPNDLVGQVSVIFENDSSSDSELQATTNYWFQSNTQLLLNWELKIQAGTEEDEFPIYWIHPKPDAFTSAPRHRLLFLYTKPSIFFDESVTDILSVFVEKDVPLESFVLLSENPQNMREILNKLDHRIDLIFSMGSDATAFVHDHGPNGPIPVVTVLSKDPVLLGQIADYEQGSGTHIAYTSVGVPIDVQMSYFQQLIPDLTNIAILYAKENSSAVETQVEPLRRYTANQHINLIDIGVEDRTQVVEELEGLIPKATKKMRQNDPKLKQSIFLITGSSSVSKELEIIDQLAQNIPVATLLPNLVQEKEISPVFGIGVNFESNSKLAGNYAFTILEEKVLAGNLPVGVITPPDLAINFAKAREIDLKIPFHFFESASTIYGPDGQPIRLQGKIVQ